MVDTLLVIERHEALGEDTGPKTAPSQKLRCRISLTSSASEEQGLRGVRLRPGDLYIARAAARNDVAEALPAPRIRSWAHLADSRSIHLAIWFFLLTYLWVGQV